MQFGKKYAEIYNLLYTAKEYQAECDFLEEIFKRFSEKKPAGRPVLPFLVLDTACGTGNHAIELAKRGYTVTGIDASKYMIGIAREKAKRKRVDVDFRVADMQNFHLDEKFDATIVMFSGMDYVLGDKDVDKTLSNINSHLKENGILIFDFWNGHAVLERYEPTRVKTVENGNRKVIRTSNTKLGELGFCEVSFDFQVIENGKIVDQFSEKHDIRYYFPTEMRIYLEENGFDVLKMCPFMDMDGKIDDDVWNVSVIARC